MAENTRRYLIAYDIPHDLRRARIAKLLEGYGDRIQYSVFAVDVRPAKMVRLRAELGLLARLAEDSILLCDLGPVHTLGPRAFEFLGQSRPITGSGPQIL